MRTNTKTCSSIIYIFALGIISLLKVTSVTLGALLSSASNSTLTVIHGSGNNLFVVSPNGRHQISLELIREAQWRNANVTMKTLPDSEIISIPKLESVVEDLETTDPLEKKAVLPTEYRDIPKINASSLPQTMLTYLMDLPDPYIRVLALGDSLTRGQYLKIKWNPSDVHPYAIKLEELLRLAVDDIRLRYDQRVSSRLQYINVTVSGINGMSAYQMSSYLQGEQDLNVPI